jgi:hypothetical protein
MAKILRICKLNVTTLIPPSSVDYYFQGSSSYEGLEGATGVSLVKDDEWFNQEPLVPVANLIAATKCQRLIIRYKSTAGVNKDASLIISKNKVAAAEGKDSTLKGKKYLINGDEKGTIVTARIKRDRYNRY